MLPKEAILEFQMICQKELQVSVSSQEAQEKAENFIQLFDMVTNIHKNKYEKSQPILRT